MKFTIFILFLLINSIILAQDKNEVIQQRIEFIAEQNESESIDLTSVLESLNYYYENPLNLNQCTFEELESLNLLTEIQINDLLLHLQKNGKLISIYELQTLKYWDLSTIQLIIPFIKIDEKIEQAQLKIADILKYGKSELYNRYQLIPQPKIGYLQDTSISSSNYQGNADHYYSRYRFSYRTNLSFGITADKDPGEPFFKGINKKGFDFYSAHAYYRGGKYLKAFIIGDYHLGIGQGLALWTNYAFGKTADVAMIKKSANSFKPYTSTDENRFLRGFAVDFGFSNFTLTLFGSSKKMDATVEKKSISTYFSSIQLTGLHRTTNEIERKNAITENILGSCLNYKIRNFEIDFNGIYQSYNIPYQKNILSYNKFDFRGKETITLSVNYNWIWKNLNVFGEIAQASYSKGIAQIHGLLLSLNSKFSLSFIYRNYAKNYQSFYSNAFADGSKIQNERGFYSGIKMKLNSSWTINSYLDLFSSPWLKYQVNAPSFGHDYFTQINYKPNKLLEIYARFREQNHQKNSRIEDGTIASLDDNIQRNYRLNIVYNVSENMTLKSRIEYTSLEGKYSTIKYGSLMTQDVIYKPKKYPFDLIFRYALFQTDNYDTRIYSYEANALNVFSIPAYYDKGSKGYLLIRYTFLKHFDLWIRYGKTFYVNQNSIGSEQEKINGNKKNDLTIQFRIKL
ncbi:MAG: hypothetical protein HYR91_05400 [Flavobacteriia bacterium]|nr:hypothetical protein [Flavobacteriia bacterium]